MNISCRIANADTQCGRITNPPERVIAIGKEPERGIEDVWFCEELNGPYLYESVK